MRWLINVFKALLALVALLSLLAYALPERRQIERSRVVAASAERIWPLIAEPRRWPAWSPWYAKDPAMTLSYSGPASGAGAQWSWISVTQGRGSMRFDAAEPPRRLSYSLVLEGLGSMANGDIRLEPVTGGTRVVWTFETRLGSNPLLRWFGLLLDGMLGADFETALARLAALAQQPG